MKRAPAPTRTKKTAPDENAVCAVNKPVPVNANSGDRTTILAPRSGFDGQSGQGLPEASAAVLEHLSDALGKVTAASHPRTFRLLESGRRKSARKLIEEACEVAVEVVNRDADGVVRESADLLYHLVVLWSHAGVEPIDVWQEMQARAAALGIAEKRPKPSAPNGASTTSNH